MARERILLLKADGKTVKAIAEKVMASATCAQALPEEMQGGRSPFCTIDELFQQDGSRTSLRGISVNSKEELVKRICKRFDEISETPVVFHWRCRMEEIDPPEEVKRGIAIYGMLC